MRGFEIFFTVISVISAIYIGIIQPIEKIVINNVFDIHYTVAKILSALVIIFTVKLLSKMLRKDNVKIETM